MSVTQTPASQTLWERARAIGRGVLAVLVFLLTAADALLTAVIGVPPLAWTARRICTALGDEFRRGYWDAIDAEEITDPAPGDEPRD
jgi:hypothetical protein